MDSDYNESYDETAPSQSGAWIDGDISLAPPSEVNDELASLSGGHSTLAVPFDGQDLTLITLDSFLNHFPNSSFSAHFSDNGNSFNIISARDLQSSASLRSGFVFEDDPATITSHMLHLSQPGPHVTANPLFPTARHEQHAAHLCQRVVDNSSLTGNPFTNNQYAGNGPHSIPVFTFSGSQPSLQPLNFNALTSWQERHPAPSYSWSDVAPSEPHLPPTYDSSQRGRTTGRIMPPDIPTSLNQTYLSSNIAVQGSGYSRSSSRTSSTARSATSSFSCSTCNKTFDKLSACRHHERYHGDRQHECQKCNKKYHFPKDLERHVKTHTDTRDFTCPHRDCKYASKGFRRSDHLRRHLRKVHGEGPPA